MRNLLEKGLLLFMYYLTTEKPLMLSLDAVDRAMGCDIFDLGPSGGAENVCY